MNGVFVYYAADGSRELSPRVRITTCGMEAIRDSGLSMSSLAAVCGWPNLDRFLRLFYSKFYATPKMVKRLSHLAHHIGLPLELLIEDAE